MQIKEWILIAVFSLSASCSYGQQNKQLSDTPPGVAVIELFTSEGCSSCPPAEALMPRLRDEYGNKLIILSFHVDYWNRLGWKDIYSNAEYAWRQNLYAQAFQADNVYTPQAIVNGKDQTPGSNQQALATFIDQQQNPSSSAIVDKITPAKKGEWTVVCTKKRSADQVLHLVLIQLHAITNVRNGENKGRTLNHFDVVRDFRTIAQIEETATFTLPDGLPPEAFHIVALIQDMKTMHITAAQELNIR